MQDTVRTAMQERVDKGAKFLDTHYPNWWQHIDLGTLSIASCDSCVLGQVYDQVPKTERAQLLAQAVYYWRNWHDFAEEAAHGDSRFGKMANAFTELQYGGAVDCGFSWTPGNEHIEEPVLTELWTELIIQRRLDAHPDVVFGFSKLDSIEKEPVTV